MDLGTNSTVKPPESETETPVVKLPLFSNGVLKRHTPAENNHGVSYKECLKNHAASLGGHALDGCGEFMPAPNSNPAEPTSLKCAACGCHRNFHRREPDGSSNDVVIPALEYHPHNRHHPPPPSAMQRGNSSGSPMNSPSPSPPPISSSYFPSSAHTFLTLNHGLSHPAPENSVLLSGSGSRKRFRTKFTQYQKEKMLELAEKVGWKMQKKDEDLINESCSDISVDKSVFKVWMHNNKNTLGKKDQPPETATPPAISFLNGATATVTPTSVPPPYPHGGEIKLNPVQYQHQEAPVLGTNGSSSSS